MYQSFAYALNALYLYLKVCWFPVNFQGQLKELIFKNLDTPQDKDKRKTLYSCTAMCKLDLASAFYRPAHM